MLLIIAHQDIPLLVATNAKGLLKGSSNPPEEVPGEENKSALTRWGTAFLLKSAIFLLAVRLSCDIMTCPRDHRLSFNYKQEFVPLHYNGLREL